MSEFDYRNKKHVLNKCVCNALEEINKRKIKRKRANLFLNSDCWFCHAYCNCFEQNFCSKQCEKKFDEYQFVLSKLKGLELIAVYNEDYKKGYDSIEFKVMKNLVKLRTMIRKARFDVPEP